MSPSDRTVRGMVSLYRTKSGEGSEVLEIYEQCLYARRSTARRRQMLKDPASMFLTAWAMTRPRVSIDYVVALLSNQERPTLLRSHTAYLGLPCQSCGAVHKREMQQDGRPPEGFSRINILV